MDSKRAMSLVLQAFLKEPDKSWFYQDLHEVTNLTSASIYPALIRLEKQGWIQPYRENIDESAEGRLRRRFYRLNPMYIDQTRAYAQQLADESLSRRNFFSKLRKTFHKN